ncbi:hypothetical protein [Priestia aryabhattai]|uniref:hypothetical protein n=1 Tax=Priestia aryabhattai TaxID=412384 RepID=UPI0027E40511|nr:hypothetical protein [Priestia aryabhattai]MCG0048365.1 hypothetical protein [Priestia aryabhattai]
MTFSWLIPYIAVSLIIVLIPGQDMIFVMTQSIASGVKAGIKAVIAFSYLLHLSYHPIFPCEVS